jgi:Protein of unknown function (DUF2795)
VARLPVYGKKEESIMAVSPKDVERFLKGVDYPATKEDLIKHVQREQEILPRVLEALKQLPDETFDGPIAVSKAIGEIDRRSKASS